MIADGFYVFEKYYQVLVFLYFAFCCFLSIFVNYLFLLIAGHMVTFLAPKKPQLNIFKVFKDLIMVTTPMTSVFRFFLVF